jgi:hypothetical protein
MKGVMSPGVSAGSNQVGAGDTWTAQVIRPSEAASAGPDDTITPVDASVRKTDTRATLAREPSQSMTSPMSR